MYENAGTLHLTFLGAPYTGGNTYDRTLDRALAVISG